MLKKPFYLSIAVPSKFHGGLDYLPEPDTSAEDYRPGVRVVVPFGRREIVGVLLAVTDTSSIAAEKLRPVRARLDEAPWLSPELLTLLTWCSQYYHHPVGEVMACALPQRLRQAKPIKLKPIESYSGDVGFVDQVALTAEQADAVDEVNREQGFNVFLLNGVTGSGKTEVYMQVTAERLAVGQQVLLLVPEIGLTPQNLSRFQERFAVPVVALHSGLTPAKRLLHWRQIASGDPLIVIGTRLAVFAPFANLGLVVVDEEHDLSYKQQTGLRYSARDVAIKRCHSSHIPIVLGSATPSLESLHKANSGQYHELRLTSRVSANPLPLVTVVDMKKARHNDGLSDFLIEKIQQCLSDGNQALFFLNRRGYAPVVRCHHCGWSVMCDACDANMVWHKAMACMQCHHCGVKVKRERVCGGCGQSELAVVGAGTEKIEEKLSSLFPDFPVLRIDKDSANTPKKLEGIIDNVNQNNPAVLIGTQMLAKGHHFSGLKLVAIADIDSGLFSVDFRASERLAQLVVQVAGRAGRSGAAGEVVLQTYHKAHPFLQLLTQQGYLACAAQLLKERREASLPPFSFVALVAVESKVQDEGLKRLSDMMRLVSGLHQEVLLMGPVAAPIAKRQGFYRCHVLVQSVKRSQRHDVLSRIRKYIFEEKGARGCVWSIDVDVLDFF